MKEIKVRVTFTEEMAELAADMLKDGIYNELDAALK
jgi:hypothetical protein